MHAIIDATAPAVRRAKSFTRGPRVLWTQDEVERLAAILRDDPKVVFTSLTGRFPGRSGVAIRLQAQLLGLSEAGTRKPHATPEEVAEALRLLRAKVHLGEIVRLTGRTHRYLHKLAGEHGIEVTIGAPALPARPKPERAPKVRAPKAVVPKAPRQRLPAAAKATPQAAIVAAAVPLPQAARAPVATAAAPVSAEMAFLLAPKQPTAASKSRTTTFGRGFGRQGVKVARTPELTAMIADFVAKRGVTRIEPEPVDAAAEALRRRGYVVLRDGGDGFIVDHKVSLPTPGDLIAYARQRGLMAA